MKWTLSFLAALALLGALIPLSGCGSNPNGPEPSLTDTVGSPPKITQGPASAKNPRNRPATGAPAARE